jgi:uncharacterized membrane protein SirB2
MLRKEFLSNPNYPSYFIYGGLLLIFLRAPAAVYNVAESGSLLSSILIGVGALFIGTGFFMRFYQAKQNRTLNSFFFSLALGLALVVVLIATGIIHAPVFLQGLL